MFSQSAIEFGRKFRRDGEGRIGIVFCDRIPQIFNQLNAFSRGAFEGFSLFPAATPPA